MRMGAQIALYPMTDRFVDVILPAIDVLKHTEGLDVSNDDLSTLLLGEVDSVFAATRDMFAAAASHGAHVVLNALFSRGCPGDSYCDPRLGPPQPQAVDQAPPEALSRSQEASGVRIAAQYSLYPLGTDSYMDQIYRVIGAVRESGSFTGSKNFCTRLDGDADAVFDDLYRSFVAADAAHSVVHATISAHSPSTQRHNTTGGLQ